MTAQDRMMELEARLATVSEQYDTLIAALQTVAQELTAIHLELTRLKETGHSQ